MRGLYGEEKRRMETLVLIGKLMGIILCFVLMVVVIVMFAVLLVCLIRDFNDKE